MIPVAAANVPKTEVALEKVKGDPKAIEAVHQFLSVWALKRDYDKAVSYLSPRSYVCLEKSDDPARKGLTPDQAQQALREGFQKAGQAMSRGTKLDDVVQTVVPHHELLKLISHKEEKAFSLVSVPDGMAETSLCGKQSRFANADLAERNKIYGHYYGAAFQLKMRGEGEEAATLYTLWTLEDGNWKVVSWEVMAN